MNLELEEIKKEAIKKHLAVKGIKLYIGSDVQACMDDIGDKMFAAGQRFTDGILVDRIHDLAEENKFLRLIAKERGQLQAAKAFADEMDAWLWTYVFCYESKDKLKKDWKSVV